MGFDRNKQPTTTKRGPGRVHVSGHKRASPIKPKGAPFGFIVHAATAAKRERREYIAEVGRRQALRHIKTLKRLAKQVRAEAA